MYVKIVEYLDAEGVFPKHGAGDLVVPTRNHVFETESVEYKKVRVSKKKELDDALLGLSEYGVIGYLPEFCDCVDIDKNAICDICRGNPNGLASFEFIVLHVLGSSVNRNYIVNGTLYIMNDQGKTIDSLHCH